MPKTKTRSKRKPPVPGDVVDAFGVFASADNVLGYFETHDLALQAQEEAGGVEKCSIQRLDGVVDHDLDIWVRGAVVTVLGETPKQTLSNAISRLAKTALTTAELDLLLAPEMRERVLLARSTRRSDKRRTGR